MTVCVVDVDQVKRICWGALDQVCWDPGMRVWPRLLVMGGTVFNVCGDETGVADRVAIIRVVYQARVNDDHVQAVGGWPSRTDTHALWP